MRLDIGNIHHAGIHTDIADDGTTLSVYQHNTLAIAKVAIQPVCIADGDDGNARVAVHIAPATVADGITLRHVLYLENRRLQRADITQAAQAGSADTVEADAQAHHVHLVLRETLDAGGIEDMLDDFVFQPLFQGLRGHLELPDLLHREVVEDRRIAPRKMREDRTRHDTALLAQTLADSGHIAGLEAQAVHSRVHFNMDGVRSDSAPLGFADDGVEEAETIDFRLQIILEEDIEAAEFRIHNHNRNGDASFAQFLTLVGDGDGEIVAAMLLQGLC